jgi:hypothetical protein
MRAPSVSGKAFLRAPAIETLRADIPAFSAHHRRRWPTQSLHNDSAAEILKSSLAPVGPVCEDE